MADKSRNEEVIFNAAIKLKKGPKRKAYLAKACGDDSKLRADVEALLQAHEAKSLIDEPIFDPDVTLDSSPLTEVPGTVIGNYKLLEQIGEGGMAVVYMAEQEKPLRRKVALKIIKLGMDTKSVIARFEAERQALAMMDHPNIARVIDAGTTETGRPYFVMELVKGISINDYCDKNNLTTKERLDLFIQVCSAVQHAHQKGIIHRDIKPSNVMVTLHDGKPVPKVIDFGIAKATSQRLTEKTLFTRYAQMIGTPAYMSPEQAEMSGLDVDTRTDIYSLGVLLYELLTGSPPFSEEKLREAGYLEMQRIIREEEPTKPSTKLSTLGKGLTDVAEHRKTNPDLLQKLVRGDLDWIAMKSLEKNRTRRYDTAAELAADIERHLQHEPVKAAEPTLLYKAHKFIRRHRVGVMAGSLIAATICVGALMATIGFLNANSQHKLAESNFQRASINFQKAQEAVDEMTRVAEERLANVPGMEQVREELLQKAQIFYQGFPEASIGEQEVRRETGRAYRRVGDIHNTLGQHGPAQQAYRKAIDLFEKLAEERPDVAEYCREIAICKNGLGVALQALGRHGQAEDAYNEATALLERLAGDFPNESDYSVALADTYDNQGHLLKDTGQLEKAEQAYRKALKIREKLVSDFPTVPDHSHRLVFSRYNLGLVLVDYVYLGHSDVTYWYQEAEQLFSQALQFQKKLVADFPEMPAYQHQLARIYLSLGELLYRTTRYQESEKLLCEGISVEEVLVAKFPAVPDYQFVLAECMSRLGHPQLSLGQQDQAEKNCRQAVAHFEKLITDSPNIHSYHVGLARSLTILPSNLERSKVIVSHLRKAVQLSPMQPWYRKMLARECSILANKTLSFDEAKQAWVQTIALYESLMGQVPECKYELSIALNELGKLLRDTGREEEAEQIFNRTENITQNMADRFSRLPKEYRNAYHLWHPLSRHHAFVDYKVRINKVGDYRLYVRCDAHDLGSDSFYAWIEEQGDGPRGIVADWYHYSYAGDADFATNPWYGSALFEGFGRGQDYTAAVWSISSPREYTIRFAVREDGAAIDAFTLQLSSLSPPEQNGLEESQMTEGRVFLESDGRVVVEAEHFTSRTPFGANWLIVPDEDSGDIVHLNFRGTGYIQALPDTTATFTSPEILNHHAQLLATGTYDKRYLPRVVEMFEEAVKRMPEMASCWNMLGMAYYRANKWEDAIAALHKSTELSIGGDGFDSFFLAMAHWQLGHKDEARHWYAQAIEWMRQHMPNRNDEQFKSLRAEVASALDLKLRADAYELPVTGEHIRVVAFRASSSIYPENAVSRILNSSGLADWDNDGLLEHDTDSEHMWLGNINHGNIWFEFELAGVRELGLIKVWNFNGRGQTNRGVKKADISVWTESTGWQKILDDFEFAEAEGTDDYDEPVLITLDGVEVQKVRFDDFTNLGDTEYIGLSEVEFLEAHGSRAVKKSPADRTDVGASVESTLSWLPGLDVTAYNVYLGTDPEELKLLTKVSINDPCEVKLGKLEKCKWYCWRVDSVKSDGSMVQGNPWSFSTGNMVGWWKLDETEGRHVIDSSGFDHHGMIVGNPQWQTGRIGGALEFDGIDDYVYIANNPNFDITNEITVLAWIRVNLFDIGWQTIVAKSGIAWRLQRYAYGNSIEFACTGTSVKGTPWGNVVGRVNVNDGRWHYVASVYDGTTLSLYIDGVLDASVSASGSININNLPLYIGATPDRWWNGLIDDVRIYSYALSEEEVKELYAGRGPGPIEKPKWLMEANRGEHNPSVSENK